MYVDVRPVSVLVSTTVICFPSGMTVLFEVWTTLPSRLSLESSCRDHRDTAALKASPIRIFETATVGLLR
jgi:hypothetical protein